MENALRPLLIAGLQDMPASRVNWGEHVSLIGAGYIVLNIIDLNEDLTLDGPDGLELYRVQVDCYAPFHADAGALAASVKALLSGYRGGAFLLIKFAGMRRLRENGDDQNSPIYRASLDFMVHWRRTP